MTRRLALGVLTVVLVSADAVRGETADDVRKRLAGVDEPRILFVGNSYSFRVPKALATLLQARGQAARIEQVTKGGWTLRKHAESEETLGAIREGKWHVVVFQEQSQLPAFGKARREKEMIPHAKVLAAEARRSGAIPVFFLTWGRRDGDRRNEELFPEDTFERMQKRLDTGYADAAKACGDAPVVPVGTAWAREVKAGRGGPLYTKDGSHPSAAGVELCAKVFASFLFGQEEEASSP